MHAEEPISLAVNAEGEMRHRTVLCMCQFMWPRLEGSKGCFEDKDTSKVEEPSSEFSRILSKGDKRIRQRAKECLRALQATRRLEAQFLDPQNKTA